jgi:probable phosphoglycerate mutase
MDAPVPPTTTLLLRHGQTRLSIEKRFSGIDDVPLTEAGQAQAAAVADLLKGRQFDAIVSSPLSRAKQTAAAVAQVLGAPVRFEDDLRETDFGAWEGYTFAEVQARWGAELAAWLADPQVAPPGGESFAATTARVARARDRLIARYPRGNVLIVTHTTPIKTLVRLALNAPPEALYRMHLDLASLTEIDWYSDGPAVLRSLNVGHSANQ